MAAGLKPVQIIIRGQHATGRTTLARLIEGFLRETGYRHVEIFDTEPLSHDVKGPYPERSQRNRDLRPVVVKVELDET